MPAPDDPSDVAFALTIALEVVQQAHASGRPADGVLRARLRELRLAPRAAAAVARTVFAWYRWRGLVGAAAPDAAALARAVGLADRFARDPASFDDVALVDGAVPGWLTQQMAVTAPFVRALQSEPVLWLRARPGRAAKLAKELPGATAQLFAGVPDAVRYAGELDLFRTPAFHAGEFEIQDIASQAVAIVCAPQPGATWWDACAGEGGKTLHLADMMQKRGVVWASDRSARRLEVLRRRAARAGIFNYRIAAWSGAGRTPLRAKCDGVLVDAPCSGVGTWQRNPHARWACSPADVRELQAVQLHLLAAAAGAVKPGGRLVYAVCTLTADETEAVAAEFGRTQPGFLPAPFADPFDPAAAARAQARWEPQHTRGNGMFVAAWRRDSH